MEPQTVTVHYFQSGIYRQTTIGIPRPKTYFDKLIVACVQETLPAMPMPSVQIRSVRGAARYAYHASRRVTAQVSKPRRFDSPVLDLRAISPNNMAHLLLDAIPYCLYGRTIAGPDTIFLFSRMAPPFEKLLMEFGIVPRYEFREVAANAVKLRGGRGLAVYDLKDTFDCCALDFLPNSYADFDFASSTGSDRIFLARRGARSLQNHSEVERVVAAHGYQTIFMEDYSVRDQLSIGARAQHVVALHGAAMGLLAVSKRLESIIEILPAQNYLARSPVASGPQFKRYEQIIPDYDPVVVHNWPECVRFKNLPFAVDTALLARLLAEID